MALTLSGDDGVAGVNGSATTPAIQGTDTNTGLTFGTDTVNVVTGGSTRATVDSSGRVGVGETSPTHLLHVKDASQSLTGATLKLESSATTGAADTGPVIQFYGHSGSEPRYHSAIKGAKENGTSGNTAGYLAFATRPAGGAMAEQVRIASDGEFRFNSGYGSVATAYGVRAWVNFNGSGTVSIRGSGNVSSISDNGTGQFYTNFANGMPDTNYAGVCSHNAISGGNDGAQASPDQTYRAFVQTGAAGSWQDPSVVCVAIFR